MFIDTREKICCLYYTKTSQLHVSEFALEFDCVARLILSKWSRFGKDMYLMYREDFNYMLIEVHWKEIHPSLSYHVSFLNVTELSDFGCVVATFKQWTVVFL